jgi:hypothetical protein
MGLDMYLNKKHYVQKWSFQTPEEQFEVVVMKGGKPYPHIQAERINYVEEQVMYWRKFNALHAWFVENVQNGVDECQTSHVDRTTLEGLLEILQKVVASLEGSPKVPAMVESGWDKDGRTYAEIMVHSDTSVAEELFPTQAGFFFGGTEYDEYYIEQVKETISMLEKELAVEGSADYTYHASW